ncbi:glucose 1-dehydrogenase [Membranicola marinus]|uniref:Glucose 1-dehydrogenase n=1 Tax=Membranihabitans marinus TaxID=1227546 RepID=A0A953HSY4_9BACT|nr:glucose 1-dehydrogenase [Membranihabitans marinus]MBY5957651.1 glucose 1-dehydrogenase [Membranihabitans marinus]
MKRFTGKTVLVTGSTSGIGKGIARRLASEGAQVVVNSYRDQDDIQEILEFITAQGGAATFIKADVGNVEEVRSMIDQSVSHFGSLDVLVNNAGIQIRSSFLETTEEQFDQVVGVNMKGAYFTAQAFAQYVVENKKNGVIVNNSSVHEILPFPHFDSYAMSKGGLQMMTRNLAVELAPLGIRVNNVAPGAIDTDINVALNTNDALKKNLLENISMGRMGTVDEVAAVVAFLASDEASYVTGATYLVDGGLTYHYTEQ